jgi:CHAD domain-containing protein
VIPAATSTPVGFRADFARLARSQSRRYVGRFRAARAYPGRSAVHALRTATRRLLALLLLIEAGLAAAGDPELERLLRRPFKACGKVRDLQVMTRSVRVSRIRHPEVAPFLRHLEQRLARQRRRLLERLAEAHPRRLERAFRDLAARIEAGPLPTARPDPLAALLARELARTRQAAEAASRAGSASDVASIHRARLAIKCHRYQAELLRRMHAPFAAPGIEQLRRFQAALGAIADDTALLESLDAYATAHPKAGVKLARYRLRIERGRQRRIARYLPTLVRRARSSASRRRS